MEIRPPIRPFITPIEDSRRWSEVTLRPDDIIIVTPPKCGTTWTQGIVRSLLWPDGDPPGSVAGLSAWIDMKNGPLAETAARIEAQTHRRFLKTHSPVDAIPFADEVRYLGVYRDGPDALVSWGNHRARMNADVMAGLNQLNVGTDLPALPERFSGDYDELFEEWAAFCSPARHLAPLWPLRDRPNVLLLHYTELWADLGASMRRIARFLDIEIEASRWPAVIERCTLEAMRTAADSPSMHERFDGGAAGFFYRGGNGRGRRLLSPAQVARCDRHSAEVLPPDAVRWLAGP
ncbi:MAG: sulfotransferase domain-containing protein [Actinomycetota bacterium]